MARQLPKGVIPVKNNGRITSYGCYVTVKPFPRVWKSFPTAKAAAEWRDATKAELQKQRESGGARPELATLSMADLNTEYLKDPETRLLADYKDRTRHLAWWSAHYGTVKVIEFGVMQGRAARDALIPGRAPGTVVRYVASQRAAWNWGRAAGLVPKDRGWVPGLTLTEPDARTRYLSDDELKALLTEAEKDSPVMHAAITVALATGVRSGEMLRLEWKDVDLENSTIRLLLTKTGIARSVHMPAIAAETLKVLQAQAEALKKLKPATVLSARVFLYRDGTPMTGDRLHHAWCEIRKAAGLKDFRWHDLRHSCASFLAQHGASLVEIGSVLGHKRAQTTLKYSHLVAGRPVTGHAALDEKLRSVGAKTKT